MKRGEADQTIKRETMTGTSQATFAGRTISAKILLVAIVAMILGEGLLFLPSIARYRSSYIEQRLLAAELVATAAVEGASAQATGSALTMLREIDVEGVSLAGGQRDISIGLANTPERRVDYREAGFARTLLETIETMLPGRHRQLAVRTPSPIDRAVVVDLVLDGDALRRALLNYAGRVFFPSLILSLIVCATLYFGLQRMFALPMRRLVQAITLFRDRPEDISRDRPAAERADEIGLVEREFVLMRADLRQSLMQQRRLAALGSAVSQITHELRNVLASATLLSDRLERSQDPSARDVGSKLLAALDRAVRLCGDATTFARTQEAPLRLEPVALAPLAGEVERTLAPEAPQVCWSLDIDPALAVQADRLALRRVLLTLVQNAADAMAGADGRIEIQAHASERTVFIYVTDDGPPIPVERQADLFERYSGSSRPAGAGLGLVICRELLRGQGGDLELVQSADRKTSFRLCLPPSAAG